MGITSIGAHWSEEGYNDISLKRVGVGSVISVVMAKNCGHGSGTIADVGNDWHVDKQKESTSETNLQVQRKGIFAKGTKTSIGGVLLAKSLVENLGDVQNPESRAKATAIARHGELTREIRNALLASTRTWAISGPASKRYGRFRFYRISGSFSS